MSTRQQLRDNITALLQQGLADAAIARDLGCSRQTVATVRDSLGIPARAPHGSPEAAYRANAQPAAGGHMDWAGGRQAANGTPIIRLGRSSTTAARIAFRIRTGREPQGTVRPECGQRHCVAPDHIEDAPGRLRIRLQTRYLLGGAALPAVCRNGHDQNEHGRLQPDGCPYCAICLANRRAGHDHLGDQLMDAMGYPEALRAAIDQHARSDERTTA